jgi:hypothetical protein
LGLEQKALEMAERVKLELRAFGDEVVADIRKTIGTPYPPSSKPGEPPHKRTGELQAGIIAEVETFVDAAPAVRISSTAPHSKYVSATRPFLPAARAKWAGIWRERARKAIRNG